jgi:hypothetical protein
VSQSPSLGADAQFRLAEALLSLDDAITLLEWRYAHDADESVARLWRLREELRMALELASSSAGPMH